MFTWGRQTYLMGVLNVTPDSFSDGGRFDRLDLALTQAQQLVNAGADILDIGGQSTRPGAPQISLQTELDRVLPVIHGIRQHVSPSIPISIDTTRVAVGEAAIVAGATWLNDISGGTFEPAMLQLAVQHQVPIVLMHLRGTPETMQTLTDYSDYPNGVVGAVGEFLCQQAQQVQAQAQALGLPAPPVIFDPGIGFAKTAEQSLELLRHTDRLKALGYPLLIGPSRKSFIGKLLDRPNPSERIWGTAAACCRAIAGGADILRVHDVAEMHDIRLVADALWR
jgi:dihydropteroate synthase